MSNVLLVIGNDKIGRKLISQLGQDVPVHLVIDASSSPQRIWKLLKKRIVTLPTIIKMGWAELWRPDYTIDNYPQIRSNRELLEVIHRHHIECVYLFRAGLIINKKVLTEGVEILNVHCAKIPEYGGLGSIARALAAGALEQEATLHRVTIRIDEGQVLATRPYRLDQTAAYRHNEAIAYDAGIQLLLAQIQKRQK